jgi:enamine deaminase RidA (YjgF/YER057c/UK114 family)
MERRNISTGTPWEAAVGYSRAVRKGPFVCVTGTMAANPDGSIIAPGDAGGQTEAILAKIEAALKELGAEMSDVVRTRIYVTDQEAQWEAVGAAHKKVFGAIRPATTMVEVSRLAAAEAVVEIEADAIVG